MKLYWVALASFLALAIMVGLASPSVFACDALDDIPLCFNRPWSRPASSATLLPSGASPSQARDVPDDWQALEPRASVWFKTDYSDNFRVLEYWLETNLPDVARFAVYAPDQTEGLSAATKPVGRGTHSKNDPDNLIRWKAGYAWPGIWYVWLTNNSDQPISFKLNHNQESVSAKTCISYWEFLGGERILWTDCGRYGPPK